MDYARLSERWLRTPPCGNLDSPLQVLSGMLDQRVRLGLVLSSRPKLADVGVVPVVAIQRGANQEYIKRFCLGAAPHQQAAALVLRSREAIRGDHCR